MSTINNVSEINAISFKQNEINTTQKVSSSSAFEEFYNAAVQVLNETNNLQIKSEEIQQDYASGRTDDMLSVVLAQSKADVSLNFTLQVTNRVVEAYREIMRMQM